MTDDVGHRLERLEKAVVTMAYWLVEAQTGFGATDAYGISAIIRGEKDEIIGLDQSERVTRGSSGD